MTTDTPEVKPFEFSTPVVLVEGFRPKIRDVKLFSRLPMLAADKSGELAAEVMPDVIDLLDRAVIGGVLDRDVAELWPLVTEVSAQMQALGNPKN
jgi:hypothetical protein